MGIDDLDPWREALRRMERDLAVPENLIATLFDEPNDWSFVIKAHALIEAALADVLTAAIDRDELREVISRMSTGDKRQGKLGFAKALGLVDDQVYAFIQHLGRIRNLFVHDVHSITRRIEDLVNPLGDAAAVWTAIGRCAVRGEKSVLMDGRLVAPSEWARRAPKAAIYGAILHCMLNLHAQKIANDATSKR